MSKPPKGNQQPAVLWRGIEVYITQLLTGGANHYNFDAKGSSKACRRRITFNVTSSKRDEQCPFLYSNSIDSACTVEYARISLQPSGLAGVVYPKAHLPVIEDI